MKKTILCLLLCVLFFPFSGKAETNVSTDFDIKKLAEDTVFLAEIDDPSTAILGLEKNADKKRYPASTTKIMTCIVALENSKPEELVKVSKKACRLSDKNSKMGLKPDEVYPMIDLLYGLMLPSGNDAAIAIAEHVGGSVDGFAKLMNAKAAELGMNGSHFLNPHGLHNADHYTTARDLSVLTAYALKNEQFAKIVSTKEYTAKSKAGRKIALKNANRLLRDITATGYKPYSCLYPDAIGVKTGDTHLAGKCLVAAARRNGTTYIAVLLHGESAPDGTKGKAKDKFSAQRFLDAIELFEYAFEHDTVTVDVSDLIDRGLPETYAVIPDRSVSLATEALYRIEWNDTNALTLPRWQADAFLEEVFPEDLLHYSIESYNAPVGEIAGTVEIMLRNEVVFKGELIAEEYTYPATPEPIAEPTYLIVDSEETPAPTPASTNKPTTVPNPESTPYAIPTPSPAHSWFWSFFRCSPDN